MVVLLGANGNITSRLARLLLAQGHPVRVVGRDARRLEPLVRLGAQAAVGELGDAAFLASALRGASAVYAMVPHCYGAPAPMAEYARIGEGIARAVAAAGVRRVVNLSSIGAHLAAGTGPIVNLHLQEQRLNAIQGLSVMHLRPGYFFENHLNAIGIIKAYGVYSDLMAAHVPVPSVSTEDIAAVAARELTSVSPSAQSRVLHLRTAQLHTAAEAAAILGRAIGVPDLAYVQAEPAQAKAGMVQAGISPAMADLIEEMNDAFLRPEFLAGMNSGPTEITPRGLEDFAETFRSAYQGTGMRDAA